MGRGSGMGGLLALLGLALIFSKRDTKASGPTGGPTPFVNYTGRNLPHIQYEYQLSEEDPLAPDEDRETTPFVSQKTGEVSAGMYTRPTWTTGPLSRNVWVK